MATVAGIDFEKELKRIRDDYVAAAPAQRLNVIHQRLGDHQFGPNRLVTAVTAVEAFSRSLMVCHGSKSRAARLETYYAKYWKWSTISLVREYLLVKEVGRPRDVFGRETWQLFGYAVGFRNLLAHECTYLALVKFTLLVEASSVVLAGLVKLAGVKGRPFPGTTRTT